MKTFKLLFALFGVLLISSAVSAQDKGRAITVKELSALVAIDPAYKNEVTADEKGNYFDNNPLDYYTLLKAKAEAGKRGELNMPVNALDASQMLDKYNSVVLPDVLITGNEVNDISRYKETIMLWLQNNRDNIKYLDAETQGMINAEDYISLYTKQVMLNHVRKN
jgi:hypothetical protein